MKKTLITLPKSWGLKPRLLAIAEDGIDLIK